MNTIENIVNSYEIYKKLKWEILALEANLKILNQSEIEKVRIIIHQKNSNVFEYQIPETEHSYISNHTRIEMQGILDHKIKLRDTLKKELTTIDKILLDNVLKS